MREVSPDCVVAYHGHLELQIDSQDPILHVSLVPGLFIGLFIREGEDGLSDTEGRTISRPGRYVLRTVLPVRSQYPAEVAQARGVWWTLEAAPGASATISRARKALGWPVESIPRSVGGSRHGA